MLMRVCVCAHCDYDYVRYRSTLAYLLTDYLLTYCLSFRDDISGTTRLLHVVCGYGSIFLWRRGRSLLSMIALLLLLLLLVYEGP